MMRSRDAFTLIELVVVILVLGIVAAVAQPRFSGALAHHRADAAAKRIAEDLGYASTLARVSSKPVVVEFTPAAHTYRFREVADPHVSGRLAESGDPSTWYTVVLSQSPYNADLITAPASLEYDAFGMPDRNTDIVIRAGSEQRQISVVRSSGKAILP